MVANPNGGVKPAEPAVEKTVQSAPKSYDQHAQSLTTILSGLGYEGPNAIKNGLADLYRLTGVVEKDTPVSAYPAYTPEVGKQILAGVESLRADATTMGGLQAYADGKDYKHAIMGTYKHDTHLKKEVEATLGPQLTEHSREVLAFVKNPHETIANLDALTKGKPVAEAQAKQETPNKPAVQSTEETQEAEAPKQNTNVLDVSNATPTAPAKSKNADLDKYGPAGMLLGLMGMPDFVMNNPKMMGAATNFMNGIISMLDPIIKQFTGHSLTEMFNNTAEPEAAPETPQVEAEAKTPEVAAETKAPDIETPDKKVTMDVKMPPMKQEFTKCCDHEAYEAAQASIETPVALASLDAKAGEELMELWNDNKDALLTPEEKHMHNHVDPAAKMSVASLG